MKMLAVHASNPAPAQMIGPARTMRRRCNGLVLQAGTCRSEGGRDVVDPGGTNRA